MIELRQLTRRFGELVAVDHLSLTVQPGEIYGFLGPNGAGKTTAIRMLNGLVRPTSGTALVCGFDVVDQPTEARRVTGYVPDNPFLYDRLTAREHLRFIADVFRLPDRSARREADHWLELFQLTRSDSLLVEGYSRGMRQKLALAAALLHHPKALFLDEPTVGLDPQGMKQLRDVLRDRAADGAAVLLSTHSLDIAERLCDRVGIINRGVLLTEGVPGALRDQMQAASLEDLFLQLTAPSEPAEGDAQ